MLPRGLNEEVTSLADASVRLELKLRAPKRAREPGLLLLPRSLHYRIEHLAEHDPYVELRLGHVLQQRECIRAVLTCAVSRNVAWGGRVGNQGAGIGSDFCEAAAR